MQISDAQWCALYSLIEHGPISGEEIAGPVAMDGTRKIKFICNRITAATMQRLHALGLVECERGPITRPVDACGKKGRPRKAVTIRLTDKGRLAVADSHTTRGRS